MDHYILLSIVDKIFYFQVFHFRVDQENRSAHMFPPELVTTIFSNIKSIYKFHAEFLLPQVRLWNICKKLRRNFDKYLSFVLITNNNILLSAHNFSSTFLILYFHF